MAEQNAVATQQGTQLSVAAQVKSMISQDAVKKKFTEVLGQKAPQFLASITNVVAGSAQLKKCPATTIMSAAFHTWYRYLRLRLWILTNFQSVCRIVCRNAT